MARGKGNSKMANVSADEADAADGGGAVAATDAATLAGMVTLGVKTHRSTTNATPPSSMNAM
jgi:hypothetical protein